MKKTCLILLGTLFICCSLANAQTTPPASEKNALSERSFLLFQQGKLNEAIKLAEKVVELEKKAANPDTASLATATVNLARMKRDNFLRLREKSGEKDLLVKERILLKEKANDNAAEADELFRKALALNETGGRSQTTQTADVLSDIAWLNYKYFPQDKEKRELALKGRDRIDESEKFFAQALEMNEKLRGKDAGETMLVVLATGNFYFEFDNYDRALSYYDRYTETAEKTGKTKSEDIIYALAPQAQILSATFQDQEAANVVKKIKTITGKAESDPIDEIGFGLRSKESLIHNGGVFQILSEKQEIFRTKLFMAGGSMGRTAFENARPKSNRVKVKVIVDESGKITEAVADTTDLKLKGRAEEAVKKWIVRPFKYNGPVRKMRGYLTYGEAKN